MMPRSKLRRKDRASAGRVHAKKSAKLIQAEQSDAVTPVSRSPISRALNLNDFLSTPSFRAPEKIVASAWHEHAAFAFWLVEQLSPRMLVELGTHNGFSYFAFCQAIRMAGLSTAAFAVDCWTGDEHAGHYGEEVYQSVEAFNMERYPDISTLMKMSFEDALPYFEDGSVDMLHIDGSHYFDDVKSDFESWLPKLSNRAVVLFHDTNVRERKFGVHLLWSHVCERYPNFHFIHGHGLGVLGIGKECPAGVAALFTASADHVLTASIRNAYARLGGAVALSFQASEAARLQVAAQCSAAELANALNRRDEEMLRTQSRLAEVQGSLEQNIASAAELDLVRLGNAQLNNECEALRQRISELSDEQQRQRAGAEDATAKLKEALEGTLTALSAERQKTAEQTDRLADLEEHQRTVADSRAAAAEEARQLRAELAVQARITAEQSGVIGSLRIVQSRSEKENTALVCRIHELQRALSDEQEAARAALANAAELKSALVAPASWRFLQPFRWISGELQRRSYRRLILGSGLFDRNWYLKNYPDVRSSGVDPVLHYLKFGAMEGRDPSPLFDSDWYLQQNPDVRAAGINPLVHYVRYGAREGRDCRCSARRRT
jgi:O-antigen biosynthesis protein